MSHFVLIEAVGRAVLEDYSNSVPRANNTLIHSYITNSILVSWIIPSTLDMLSEKVAGFPLGWLDFADEWLPNLPCNLFDE